MSADALLNRLDHVQVSGKGWRTACPVCSGKSRKLSVSEADGGKVLLHAFCGCSALDVVQAVGLTLQDLFPERINPTTPDECRKARRAAREAQWGAALEVLEFEARIVQIAAVETFTGQPLSLDDLRRLETAVDRIENARSVLRDRPAWRPKAVAA